MPSTRDEKMRNVRYCVDAIGWECEQSVFSSLPMLPILVECRVSRLEKENGTKSNGTWLVALTLELYIRDVVWLEFRKRSVRKAQCSAYRKSQCQRLHLMLYKALLSIAHTPPWTFRATSIPPAYSNSLIATFCYSFFANATLSHTCIYCTHNYNIHPLIVLCIVLHAWLAAMCMQNFKSIHSLALSINGLPRKA